MKTVTINILKDEVLNILKSLEKLGIIRIHNDKPDYSPADFIAKFEGAMTKQSKEEIDKQLDDLRN